jgi:hypothetical protein
VSDNFWFLPDDGPESDAERPERAGVSFDARDSFEPFHEPMKGNRSRPQRAPSTDQKKVRRQIHRSGAHPYEEVDWNEYHPHLKDMAEGGELHRGIGVNLPDDLHRFVHDASKPVHERAAALLNHVAGMRNDPSDRRVGLGMHWSLSSGIGEDFGEKAAGHYAATNAHSQDQHDFSWGRSPGEEPDYETISDHLHEDHGIHPHDQLDPENLHELHVHLHGHREVPKGQAELFDASPYVNQESVRHRTEMKPYVDPDYAHGKPGTAVVLHTSIPDVDDIETNIHGNPHAGGEVYHPEGHGEAEVPIRHGASIPITGISWKPVHESDQEPDEEPDYTHHRFTEPEHREARKIGTVLNTQIERLNKGDQIRTPTGQTSVVQGTRPHETDSTLMYLDTDMGTSTVKRGTDFQTVPHNSQQQELPDTGNPMGSGNSGALPMSGKTPGGAGNTPTAPPGVCPNCGNAGTMHLHSGNYVCGVCGFTVPAGGTPGGLMFTNQPGGYSPARRKPGEVPRAHVWASRYVTSNEHTSQVARRARQVSGGDQ